MAEVIVPEQTISVPVTGTTEDEDYAWLTERLDALNQMVSRIESSSLAAMETARTEAETMRTSLSSLQEQNRQLTELLQTTQTNLTNLSEMVLSKLTPEILTPSLPVAEAEPIPVVVTEILPADVPEPTREPSAESVPEKGKRRRL